MTDYLDQHRIDPPKDASLEGIKLLIEAPSDVIRTLADKCVWMEFAEEQLVVDRKDDSTDVFFVVKGKLRAMGFQDSGQEVSFADLNPGDHFGELSAIDAKSRSARVVAVKDTILARLDHHSFRSLLLECPGIALMLLKRFAEIIRASDKRISRLSSRTPRQRVYFELLRLCDPSPDGDGTWRIDNLPKHEEIAGWAGSGREDVAMAIGQLAREKVVVRKNRSLIIHDHTRLQMLADM